MPNSCILVSSDHISISALEKRKVIANMEKRIRQVEDELVGQKQVGQKDELHFCGRKQREHL